MPRRAWLYVPGDQERKLVKAQGLEVDVVCLDLEDAVAVDRKPAARELVRHFLQQGRFQGEVWVRVNPANSPWAEEDIIQVLAHPEPLRGLLLPKVEAPWMVHWAAQHLARAEERHGLPSGSLLLAVLLETAAGVLHGAEILRVSPRVRVVIFGAEDLAADIGAIRTPEGHEIAWARQQVLLTAKALGKQAIDMVYIAYQDLEGLEREARQAAQMGFDGKQVIHPAQVRVVQAAFTPDEERLAWARKVWEAYQQARAEGRGVFVVEGRMIDPPLIRQARNLLERAGILPEEVS